MTLSHGKLRCQFALDMFVYHKAYYPPRYLDQQCRTEEGWNTIKQINIAGMLGGESGINVPYS
jgi:hypothetical protein